MAETKTKDTDDLTAQLKTLSDDVAALTAIIKEIGGSAAEQMGDTLSEKAAEFARRSGEMRDQAKARAKAEINTLEQHISEKPLQFSLIAFMVGVFFGAMARR